MIFSTTNFSRDPEHKELPISFPFLWKSPAGIIYIRQRNTCNRSEDIVIGGGASIMNIGTSSSIFTADIAAWRLRLDFDEVVTLRNAGKKETPRG